MATAQSSLPNIVVIFADDLGYADIEGYGAAYGTPRLKALQQQGMRFTAFYAQPSCSPSRASLMTGCYPQRVGFPFVIGPKGPAWTAGSYFTGLNPNETTVAELLRSKGYATACIGKWHLGHYQEHLPTHHGFDEYLGIPYSNDMWPPNGPYPELPMVEGDQVIETNPDQTQLVTRYTNRAIEIIRKNKSRPFFIYLAHNMPHVPIFASESFKGRSGKGIYVDVIQEIDWSVGEVMKALTDNGIEKNTILIFTSDNGPWLVYGNHGGSAGKLREGKGSTFEGGTRVPFLVRWPGHVRAGTTCDIPASLFDLLPTFAEITQAKLPDNVIDGRSMLPLWHGGQTGIRDAQYYYQGNELQAVRKGKWKLHLPHAFEHVTEAGNDGARGKSEARNIGLSLFDLEADISEATNVATAHPEIVIELRGMAKKFDEEMKAGARKPAGRENCKERQQSRQGRKDFYRKGTRTPRFAKVF
ncbi:MAG TPA: sulfatase [Chryseolinea sp.]|nr:sulfatase [Chryseolinea sp.]